jgi:hypothetical protein
MGIERGGGFVGSFGPINGRMRSMDGDERRQAYESTQFELVFRSIAYYERLALINGGAVALIVPAVLNYHDKLKHRYTLAFGLISLLLATILLLSRNYLSINQTSFVRDIHNISDRRAYPYWKSNIIDILERSGLFFSVAGFILLSFVLITSVI